MTSDSERISIRLPKDDLEILDFLAEVHDFPNRSEAIREAVRDLIYKRLNEVDVTSMVRKKEEVRRAYLEMKAVKDEYLKK